MKRNSGNQQDSYLYGSSAPQSEAHEPRLQSSGAENKISSDKKADNTKKKANGSEKKS